MSVESLKRAAYGLVMEDFDFADRPQACLGAGSPLPVLDVRIPQWDLSDLIERSCPICGAHDLEPLFRRPDQLSVKRCAECHSFAVSPAPSEAQIDAFYADYHSTHFTSELADQAKIRADLKGAAPADDVRIAWLKDHVPINGAGVLDVGCGKGTFLHQLSKLGAKTYGVEFDPAAALVAERLGALSVHVGSIETMPGDRRFDVVILKDIIEHPLRPSTLFHHCIERLKPGGTMVIWTPNGGNIELEQAPICLRVDLEHMQYLTTDSVVHLALAHGLRVVHLETVGHPSLAAIKLTARQREARKKTRYLIKSFPGVRLIWKLNQRLRVQNIARSGNYHLFACLSKPY